MATSGDGRAHLNGSTQSGNGGNVARIVLIDPAPLFSAALAALLSPAGFEVVAEVTSIERVIGRRDALGPIDILLVRAEPEIGEAHSLHRQIGRLRQAHPGTKIVLIADEHAVPALMRSAIADADAVLTSDMAPAAFLQSLRLIQAGGGVVPAHVAAPLLDNGPHDRPLPRQVVEAGLTGRETEILEMMARGTSNKQIAIALDISEATVKVHVKAVLRKIGVSNRTQAAVWALDCGLVEDDTL